MVSSTSTLLKLLHVLLEGKYIYLSKSSMQKENVAKKVFLCFAYVRRKTERKNEEDT